MLAYERSRGPPHLPPLNHWRRPLGGLDASPAVSAPLTLFLSPHPIAAVCTSLPHFSPPVCEARECGWRRAKVEGCDGVVHHHVSTVCPLRLPSKVCLRLCVCARMRRGRFHPYCSHRMFLHFCAAACCECVRVARHVMRVGHRLSMTRQPRATIQSIALSLPRLLPAPIHSRVSAALFSLAWASLPLRGLRKRRRSAEAPL